MVQALKHKLKDTKLAVKHSYPSRDQILLHHRLMKLLPFTVSKSLEKTVSSNPALSQEHSFHWLRAFLKSNSGYLWTPPENVF